MKKSLGEVIQQKWVQICQQSIMDDVKDEFELDLNAQLQTSNFRRDLPSNRRCRPHRNLDKIWGKSDKRQCVATKSAHFEQN